MDEKWVKTENTAHLENETEMRKQHLEVLKATL